MQKSRANWATVPTEIWAAVFSCLNRDLTHAALDFPSATRKTFPALRNIPRVCQRFTNIFEHTPSLSSTLYLKEGFLTEHLASMIKWTHKHSDSIDTLIASEGSPWLELILGSLLSSNIGAPVPLKQACLGCVQPETVAVLGSFSALQKLELQVYSNSCDGELPAELQDLRGLPRLTDLVLHDGHFLGLESLSYLTSLSVRSAFVQAESELASMSSLRQLTVKETSLAAFHAKGLSACSGLQSLRLVSASLKTFNGVDLLAFCHYEEVVGLHSLSALSALTAVWIDYFDILPRSNMQLSWLSHLMLLQDLWLAVRVPQLTLPESISRLTSLTKLEVISGKSFNPHIDMHVRFDFRWTDLVALQHLRVAGSARFCQGLLEITQMKALKHVKFKCLQASDETTNHQLGELACKLGATRPDVFFKLR